MEDARTQAIDPDAPAHDSESETNRRKRKRWIWILVGLGAFSVCSIVGFGLLATLVVPNVLKSYAFAVSRKVKLDLTSIDLAVEEFAIHNGGKYPDGLEVLVTPDANGQTYLRATRIPKDPWGRTYIYEPPGPGHPHPIVRTYGKDGQPGGEGDDADVDNLSLRRERNR
jgi:general secretion pathway protein G